MRPKVSVCLITYNHELYIRQCLESILAQQTDFEFEIVIGEDKSTDNTLSIISEYRQKYPGQISFVTSAANVGMIANWERTLRACKGEYIAIIEGDDYWISASKLQKQVVFLDRNKDYSFCFHDVGVAFGEGVPKIDHLVHISENKRFTIADLIKVRWFVATCSVVLRKDCLPPFPEWTKGLKAIDIVVLLLLATRGDFGYIQEKLGVYRIHAVGNSQVLWLGKENIFEFSNIEIFKHFNRYTKGRWSQLIKIRLEEDYKALMAKNPPRSSYYLKAMAGFIKLNPVKNLSVLKDWIIVNLIPPRLYKIYRPVK